MTTNVFLVDYVLIAICSKNVIIYHIIIYYNCDYKYVQQQFMITKALQCHSNCIIMEDYIKASQQLLPKGSQNIPTFFLRDYYEHKL